MKKLWVLSAAVLGLAACSGTWHGMKNDTVRNVEKTEAAVEKGWDKTKAAGEKAADKTGDALKKGAETVGKGMQKTGEYIENLGK